MKKKLLALVCALALVFSLAGCTISTPDTVGKIGDFEVTSGMYLLAQYGAYQQAAQLAGTDQDATDVKAFLKETITVDADTEETATVSDYVAQKTLENLQTYAAIELRFDALYSVRGGIPVYQPLPKFPAVTRDIAVVCAESVTVGALEDCIRRGAKGLLKKVELFDIYRGIGVAPGSKSVAFILTLRADDRSLTGEEADEDVKSILALLEAELGAKLR